jgi:16S rRNA (guanine966-N2)-methyltransferase
VAVHSAEALAFLARAPAPYDVVFIDPPFDCGLHAAVLERLAAGWLQRHALVYVEHARERTFVAPDYVLHRQGHTRGVCYQLLVPAPRD